MPGRQRGCESTPSADLAETKRNRANFYFVASPAWPRHPIPSGLMLLGRLIEMGPKSCSRASLFPYLLMALITDWREWCQNNCCMTRRQKAWLISLWNNKQATAITDTLKSSYHLHICQKSNNCRIYNVLTKLSTIPNIPLRAVTHPFDPTWGKSLTCVSWNCYYFALWLTGGFVEANVFFCQRQQVDFTLLPQQGVLLPCGEFTNPAVLIWRAKTQNTNQSWISTSVSSGFCFSPPLYLISDRQNNTANIFL